ncbi:MAG: hypothetical protein JO044_05060 [Mycobacteriaceae bacterium]|nr:hypothetical protein [Mycobacteriaceae bacterium]
MASVDLPDEQWLTPKGPAIRRRIVKVAAHQGGALVSYATDSPEPLCAAVNAAVDYVRSSAPAPTAPQIANHVASH